MSLKVNEKSKPKSVVNLVVQKLDKEILIYNSKTQKAYCLNETAAAVWQMADGTKSIEFIKQELSRQLNFKIEEEIVWLTLFELQKQDLILSNKEITNYFAQIPRRELIRKIGTASIVAFPLISALIAPQAIQAGSGVCINPNLDSCTTPQNCIDQNINTDTCVNNCCVLGPGIPAGGSTTNPGGNPVIP